MTFDMQRALAEAPRDRGVAWRFVREFAAYWGRPLRAGDGFGVEEVGAAGRRLGVGLPAALCEAYVLFGRRRDLTGNHDTFLTPEELYVADGTLVYRVANQDRACWGVPVADLGDADPATVRRPDTSPVARWEPHEPSLSVALLAMVMSEVLMLEDGLSDHAESPDAVPELERLYDELPAVGQDFRWFSGPDALVRVAGGGAWIDVRGRTPEALDAVREAVPGPWAGG
ncbi:MULTISPECIES: SMI1/KNR4 family protein [Streptomyces]|uniref:SMI1/KNR4 family protein n=1 Tax=Streptomyces fuscus TaxID=3048495 RepID=A0ABT7J888_9ACTN|nr:MULTISPECIES: SMI1/KNR4 family protein [Streptomyces]MCM1973990.1 SMI1/KNR4 family protein [Streptomyces sp. G1]MDL2081081.1 SMI1/KNR4 family protein [Streptomyces fuscus]